MSFSLSVVIPCYNEKFTIKELLKKVKSANPLEKEIIVVDDYSTDGTREILKEFEKDNQIKIIYHDKNYGKGMALRSGFKLVKNDLIIIQDADLEYNPNEYENLLRPFIEASADVVYGSRFIGGHKYSRIHYFWHYVANKLLTLICNIFTNLNMTDMETGYKVFKKSLILNIDLVEKSFGIEPELTIKLSKKKIRFFEVPISYNGRSYEEGKKINFKDAIIAFYCIIKYSLK